MRGWSADQVGTAVPKDKEGDRGTAVPTAVVGKDGAKRGEGSARRGETVVEGVAVRSK